MLNVEYFINEGLAKMESDVDYIPISIWMNPELFVLTALQAVKDSINLTMEFNDEIKNYQEKVAKL